MMKKLCVLVVSVCCLGLLAACGGGGSSSSTDSEGSGWAVEADAACKAAGATPEIVVSDELAADPSIGHQETLSAELIEEAKALGAMTAKVEAIPLPSEGEAAAKAVVAGMASMPGRLYASAEALETGEEAQIGEEVEESVVEETEGAEAKLDEEAAAAGLQICGRLTPAAAHIDVNETPDGELNKGEWIAHADAICESFRGEAVPYEEQIGKIEESGLAETDRGESEIAEALKGETEKVEGEYGKLRELQPPSDDESTIDSMLSEGEEASEVGSKLAEAFEAGDHSEVGELAKEGTALTAAAKKTAQGYGLKVCGAE
jgi:hypothetical protein